MYFGIKQTLNRKFSDFTGVFVVDSTLVTIGKMSRAKRSSICSTEPIKPEFGYGSAQKIRFFKLHAMCDKNGIFRSSDFSPANAADVNDLHDIKETFQNCLLIGDRGYISKVLQVDCIPSFQHQSFSTHA